MVTFFVERNINARQGEGTWMVTSTTGLGSGKISTHRTKQAAVKKARKLQREGDDIALEGTDAEGTFKRIF